MEEKVVNGDYSLHKIDKKIDARFVNEHLVEDTEGIKDEAGNQIVQIDKQYLDI